MAKMKIVNIGDKVNLVINGEEHLAEVTKLQQDGSIDCKTIEMVPGHIRTSDGLVAAQVPKYKVSCVRFQPCEGPYVELLEQQPQPQPPTESTAERMAKARAGKE